MSYLRITAVFFFLASFQAQAANIWHLQEGRRVEVVIEGEINQGDFRDLEVLLKEKGPLVDTVFLYSSGGDAKEAMKIGRMLRELEVTTEAPGVTIEEVKGEWEVVPECRFTPPRNQANCVCYSSCFLVWVAGINRRGSYLGVHRPRFNQDYYASLSSADAQREYGEMLDEVKEYLKNFSVPQELKEKMVSTPSHEIYRFEANRELKGFVPAYDELLTAKCGAMPRAEEKRYWLLKTKGADRTSESELKEMAILGGEKKRKLIFAELTIICL